MWVRLAFDPLALLFYLTHALDVISLPCQVGLHLWSAYLGHGCDLSIYAVLSCSSCTSPLRSVRCITCAGRDLNPTLNQSAIAAAPTRARLISHRILAFSYGTILPCVW